MLVLVLVLVLALAHREDYTFPPLSFVIESPPTTIKPDITSPPSLRIRCK